MFNFFSRSHARDATIRQALAQSGVSAATDPTRVAVLENQGQYSGRRVTFFRAFEPGHQDALLASGHVEHEGVVVINSPRELHDNPGARVPANRADHADDERLVFWDADSARVSEAALSAPAATWLHARSTSEHQP
jgi:hypothetical protein